jgi:hypothetical protein
MSKESAPHNVQLCGAIARRSGVGPVVNRTTMIRRARKVGKSVEIPTVHCMRPNCLRWNVTAGPGGSRIIALARCGRQLHRSGWCNHSALPLGFRSLATI